MFNYEIFWNSFQADLGKKAEIIMSMIFFFYRMLHNFSELKGIQWEMITESYAREKVIIVDNIE